MADTITGSSSPSPSTNYTQHWPLQSPQSNGNFEHALSERTNPRSPTHEEYQEALSWSEGQSLESAKARMEFIRPLVEALFPDIQGIGENVIKAQQSWNEGEYLSATGAVLAGTVENIPAGKVAKIASKADSLTVAKDVVVSSSKYPETSQHIREAIQAGHPDVLTINRSQASARRAAALEGYKKVPNKQLDEYPPAMFKEGGQGASVKAVNPSDNMGAGACIGNQCRGLVDGSKIKITVE